MCIDHDAATQRLASPHVLMLIVNCIFVTLHLLCCIRHPSPFCPFHRCLAAFWLTAILNVLWESPCSLAAQQPSVEASVPGSVCQSAAPIQPNLLPQLSAFLLQQTPHCRTDLHASPLHLPCVNEDSQFICVRRRRGESPINQYPPLSLRTSAFTHSSPSVLSSVAMYVLLVVCVCGAVTPRFSNVLKRLL